ncbi:MAG TPA: aconitase/3-isopropylmalate dehydratase large subunit family protein, partial [Methanocorpusculum sp.]|nr:aconitase/3-isopropylmalate dehydratase large subunit family protein [Methanocorpusculum sp.]
MGSTLTEKIFSSHCGKECRAGEVVMAPVDGAMIHDITGPLAINVMKEMGGGGVFDPKKVIMLFDHQIPADSISAAENHVMMRNFAREQGILNYDIKEGVCHQVVPEKGRVCPGNIIVGSDSHTCAYGALGAFSTGIGSTDMAYALKYGELYFRIPETIQVNAYGKFQRRVGPKDLILAMAGDIKADGATYRALEFVGSAFSDMDIPGRMTCANMAIEMGAKAGIVPPDEKTWEYLRGRAECTPFSLASDEDAVFYEKRSYDVSKIDPKVAIPHNVDNVVDVTKVAGTHVDQVFIGSCTNGRYEDFAEA